MKKAISLICIIIFPIILFGCTNNSYEGEWEGNYVYYGNTRSRTDGKEEKKLLTSFTEDGVAYEISSAVVFADHGDVLFIRAKYPNPSTSGDPEAYFLYNVKEKRWIPIASTGPACEKCEKIQIGYYFDNYFVYYRQVNKEEAAIYYTMDYTGQIIEENADFFKGAMIYGEKVFHARNGILTYSTLTHRTYEPVLEYTGDRPFLMPMGDDLFSCNKTVFNAVTKQQNTLPDDALKIYGKRYFYIREGQNDYYSTEIYRVEEDCSFTKVFTFPNNLKLTSGNCLADEKYLTFYCEEYPIGYRAKLAKYLKIETNEDYYSYDTESGKLLKGKHSQGKDIGDPHEFIKSGKKCGKYYYGFIPVPGFLAFPSCFARFDSERKVYNKMNVSALTTLGNQSHSFFAVKPY